MHKSNIFLTLVASKHTHTHMHLGVFSSKVQHGSGVSAFFMSVSLVLKQQAWIALFQVKSFKCIAFLKTVRKQGDT